jgi:hypothetical protein
MMMRLVHRHTYSPTTKYIGGTADRLLSPPHIALANTTLHQVSFSTIAPFVRPHAKLLVVGLFQRSCEAMVPIRWRLSAVRLARFGHLDPALESVVAAGLVLISVEITGTFV